MNSLTEGITPLSSFLHSKVQYCEMFSSAALVLISVSVTHSQSKKHATAPVFHELANILKTHEATRFAATTGYYWMLVLCIINNQSSVEYSYIFRVRHFRWRVVPFFLSLTFVFYNELLNPQYTRHNDSRTTQCGRFVFYAFSPSKQSHNG